MPAAGMEALATRGAFAYLCAGFALVYLLSRTFKRRPRYPPGPKGLPFIGNLLDVPSVYGWVAYKNLGEQYGSDVIHFEVLGSHYVVLNSAKAARDLLDKRSINYSDRQQTVMLHELTGLERGLGMLPYGDYWRLHRRLTQQHFRAAAVPQYHARQAKVVRRLLRSLLDTPEHFMDHIRFMAGAIILDIVYALDVRPGDRIIEIIETAMAGVNEIINAGVFLVDVIPILKHIPSWVPGAGFKRRAEAWKVDIALMFEAPYERFKQSLQRGTSRPCFAGNLLSRVENEEELSQLEYVFRNITGTAYSAGSDTTLATLTGFVLAMTVFPEKQLAAHAELDKVLERKRLPEVEDMQYLPSITALVYEVLRWNPAAPLGIPHQTIVDDEYNGYFIPAGTVVIGNAWAMLHDPNTYPDPNQFKPERFLNSDGSLRDDVPYPTEAFGHGRRICVGRHFAHDVLWLTIAHILTVFRIERTIDEDGHDIVPELDYTPHFISMPKPFKCHFSPRFAGAEDLIRSAVDVSGE